MILAKEITDKTNLEKEIYRACCKLGCEMYKTFLEQTDDELMIKRDRTVYRHKGRRKTVLKTIMGEVEYERALYECKDESGKSSYVFLLDKVLGFETIGYISEPLAERVVEASCEMSYRKAAQSVSELTGQAVSHTGAWNIVQSLGERIDKKELEAAAVAKKDQGRGEEEIKLLFEEQDGIYLTLQGKDRKKLGKSAEMKIAMAYSGAKQTGKKRYNLAGKVACANFENIEDFFARKEGAIAEVYNVDEIEMRVLNGDGANWIKRSITDDSVQYQLDTFHRNKAVLLNISNPEARKTIFHLLYSKQIDHLLTFIEAYTNSIEDQDERENALKLLKYFENNRHGLISYKHREIPLPPQPDGIVYRGCGAMESNVYSIIGRRMKNRRANWSIHGGNNLARLLTLRATGKLSDTLTGLIRIILPPQYTKEVTTVISSAKMPRSVGNGYNGFHKAAVPVSQKWMKELVALRPLY